MKPMRKIATSLMLLAVLTAGCQQPEQRQKTVASEEQANLLTAARAELNTARADHEAEIRSLERQYNDILKQREAELATLQAEVERLKAANKDLRDTIRAVKQELRKLQDVVGPETEQ